MRNFWFTQSTIATCQNTWTWTNRARRNSLASIRKERSTSLHMVTSIRAIVPGWRRWWMRCSILTIQANRRSLLSIGVKDRVHRTHKQWPTFAWLASSPPMWCSWSKNNWIWRTWTTCICLAIRSGHICPVTLVTHCKNDSVWNWDALQQWTRPSHYSPMPSQLYDWTAMMRNSLMSFTPTRCQ